MAEIETVIDTTAVVAVPAIIAEDTAPVTAAPIAASAIDTAPAVVETAAPAAAAAEQPASTQPVADSPAPADPSIAAAAAAAMKAQALASMFAAAAGADGAGAASTAGVKRGLEGGFESSEKRHESEVRVSRKISEIADAACQDQHQVTIVIVANNSYPLLLVASDRSRG